MFDLTLYLRRDGTAAQGHEASQRIGLSNWEADGGPGGHQLQERGESEEGGQTANAAGCWRNIKV